jgi:hypothetical protein
MHLKHHGGFMKRFYFQFWLVVLLVGIFPLSAPCDGYDKASTCIERMAISIKSFNEFMKTDPELISSLPAIDRLSDNLERLLREIGAILKEYPAIEVDPNLYFGAPLDFKEKCVSLRHEYFDAMEGVQCLAAGHPADPVIQKTALRFLSLSTRPLTDLLDVSDTLRRCDRQKIEEYKKLLLAGEGVDHDWPSELAETGDVNCVPALIAVLKRNPIEADGSMICTRDHCLQALRKLTGADLGDTDEVWIRWWAENQKKPKNN